jgi:hypothetical protein
MFFQIPAHKRIAMHAHFQGHPAGFVGGRRPIPLGHGQHALYAPDGGLAVVVEQRLAERADRRAGFSRTDQKQFGSKRCALDRSAS